MAVCLSVLGCKLDLKVPDPQRGRLLGSIDTQGHLPLAGQTVTLSSELGGRYAQLTDDTGAFLFGDLPPGLHVVSVSLPGFAKFNSELFTVQSGQDTDVGVLAPDWLQNTPSAGSLSGRVSANGGGDISGAKVEFVLAGTVIDQLTVGSDGLFTQPLPPGTFTLKASHPAFVSAMMMDVTLAPGATLDLTATPLVLDINPATLTGIVFKERDQGEPEPAAGALITLDSGQTTSVDAAGNFQLTGLAAGSRLMRVTLPGFHDPAVSRPVRLDPGATTPTDKVTLLIDRGSIVGTVKLADNAPVSGARVELGNGYATLVSPNAMDPSQGDFVIQNVPAGMWGLTARKEQYSIKSITVTVVPGSSVNSGVLLLSRLFGDFSIDDADPSNTSGYTRTTAVTLDLTGFPPTGVAAYRASEDATFDGGTFLPYSGRVQPFTLLTGEGAHTVYAQYQDGNGQVSQTFSSTVVLDTVRPTLPVITFESTGSDGTQRFTNRAQDLPLQVLSFDDMGSGLSLMKVGEAVDGQGNVSQPPDAYRLTATLRRAAPVDGLQRVFVQVIDNAGNVSLAGTDSITVDTAPPTGNISLRRGARATEDGFTNNPLVTLDENWADGADAGVVLIKLANASADLGPAVYQPASSSAAWFINPASDGLKTVYARFRDVAGNESVSPATDTITYDTVAPTPASITSLSGAVTRNPMVNLALTTNTADLASTRAFTISDEATFTSANTQGPMAFPMAATTTFTLPVGDGVRTIYARFTDKAGNDAFTSVAITLDTTPPEGSFTLTGALGDGTPSSTLTSTNQVTVNLVGGGATEYRLGDGTMTSCPMTGYVPLVTNTLTNQALAASGVMTLCLRDAAGNTQGPLQRSLVLDTAAPTLCVLALAGRNVDGSASPAGLTANTSITGSLSGCSEQPAEVHLASAAVTCTNTASLNWQPYSATLAVTLAPGEGARQVFGCVRDAARNVSGFTSATTTLDTTGPSPATATLVGTSPTNQSSVTVALAASDLNGLSATGAVTAAEDLLFTGAGVAGPMAFPGTSQLSFTLSAGDGAKVIYVRFRDRVGNESLVSVPVTKDQAAPTGSIVVQGALADGTPSTDWATSAAVTVLLTQAGGASYVLGDEGLITCPATGYTPITTTSLNHALTGTAAPRVVRVCLRDTAGNTSGPFEDTIPLDTAGPANCAFSLAGRRVDGAPAAAGFTAKTEITASIGGCAEAPIELVVSTSAVTCSAAAPLSWLPFSPSSLVSLASGNGTRQVFGCVRDAARNVTAISTGSITLDTAPPTPATATLLTANPTNVTATNLQLSATDLNGLGVTDAVTASQDVFFLTGLTGPSAFPGSSQLAFTLTGVNGDKQIYVRFRDLVGNEAFATVDVTLDTVVPTGSIVIQGALADGTPSTATTNTNSVTVQVTQTGATQYLLGNESLTTCPVGGYSPLTGSSVGHVMTSALNPREVRLCLKDAAGNVSTPLSDTIPFDTAGPTGCALSLSGTQVDGTAAPGGKTANTTVTASVSGCGETPTEIYLTTTNLACSAVASYPWQSYAASQPAQIAGPDGTNTLYGCVRDATHNVGTLLPNTILLDRQGPTAGGVVIDGNAGFINAAQVTIRGGTIGSVNGGAQTAIRWTVSEDPASFPAWRSLGAFDFTFGGTGVRTVYAKFKDDVGNESNVVTDTIDIDVTPPDVTSTAWAFLAPLGAQPGYSNNRVLAFSVTGAPVDAAGVQVMQAASCTPVNFIGVPVIPATNPFSYTLVGGDNTYQLCGRAVDAAGNGSAALSPITVVFDRIPPTGPNITTSPRLLNMTNVAAFTVTTQGAVTDANFDRYERSGGTLQNWTSNGTTDLAIGSTSFGYTLQQNKTNVLRLRAVDKAGNASAEDSVAITWDYVRPQPLGLRDFWVDNGSARSTFHWTTNPGDLDVVAYKVYYGPVPGGTAASLTGTNAVEGASPITIAAIPGAADQSIALTGLTDGSQVFATVTAVDQAGNEGLVPVTGSQLTNFYVALEPNAVSMNRVSRLPMPNAGSIEAISIQGDRAYVVGRTNSSCPSTGSATLTVIDLDGLAPQLSLGHPDLTPTTPTIVGATVTFPDAVPCSAQVAHAYMVDVLADGPYLFMTSGTNVRIFSLANPDSPALMPGSPITLANTVQQLNLIGDRLFVTGDPHVTAINLTDLYDGNAATTVTTADVIGTALPNFAGPFWASGSNVTRDRLIEFTYNGGDTYNFMLDNALLAAPSFTTAAASITVSSYLDGTPNVRMATGGSYLYQSNSTSFSLFRLGNLWNSTAAGPGLVGATDLFRQIQSAGGDGMTVMGNQAFVLGGTALRSIDMRLATSMSESSLNTFPGAVRSVAEYGDFLVVGSNYALNATLHFFELATPRSMHQVASGSGGGPFADLGPGFLYSGMARVHDLHAGPVMNPVAPEAIFGTLDDHWAYDMARFGDRVVTAQGPGFIIFNTEDETDRNGGTVWDVADATTVMLPSTGRRVTGVEAWGNYLVAAEVRADGVWVEVFDARPLRNPAAATFNATTHSRGAFRVANFVPGATLWASITMQAGRAIISLDEASAPPSPALYIVDVRTLMDDVAGSSVSVLGSLPLTSIQETEVRGGWLYAGGASSIAVVDIKETLQEPPVALPVTPLSATISGGSGALEVFGNHLYTVGRSGVSIRAVDVRTPTAPVVLSQFPLPGLTYGGSSTLEAGPTKTFRRGLVVRGTRLYSTYYDEVRVLELE
ncbi:MAG: carboxypeptidase-like regulatory domain-containing protein [Archangium sp.]|nr:carboxypeptidase-like regulatory domain-containing protein [Archangium sp.]